MEADLIAQAAGRFHWAYVLIFGAVVPLLVAFLGAYVGGRMTSTAASKAVKEDYKLRTEREEKQARDELRAYYQSIHAEMESFWTCYKGSYGPALKKVKDGDFLRTTIPEWQFFTVYRATASMLGRVPNDDLRKKIVWVYNLCENLYVTLVAYTKDMLGFLRRIRDAERTGQDIKARTFQEQHQSLIDATKVFKKACHTLDAKVNGLLKHLDEEVKSLALPG